MLSHMLLQSGKEHDVAVEDYIEVLAPVTPCIMKFLRHSGTHEVSWYYIVLLNNSGDFICSFHLVLCVNKAIDKYEFNTKNGKNKQLHMF